MKKICMIVLKVLGLAIITLFMEIIISLMIPIPGIKQTTGAAATQAHGNLMLVDLIYITVIAFLIIRSNWRGLRLAGALFLVVFGMQTFMMQIETIFFGSAFKTLSTLAVLIMTLKSLLKMILLVPIAVWIFGKFKQDQTAVYPSKIASLFMKDLLWKLPLLGVSYVILYYFFGFFVAWQSAAVRQFYATTLITRHLELMIPFQILRGILWVGCGLPLFVMFAKRRDGLIASIITYSWVPSMQLLIPSQVMPEPVRMAHLAEISLSMALLGLIVALVMLKKRIPREVNQGIVPN